MRAQQVQNLVVIGVLLFFAAGLGLAYWFGGNQSTAGATSAVKPVKKFRADPGTERKNAMALTSSIPSVKEETTDRPIEVWGSLDDDKAQTDEREWEAYTAVTASIEQLSPDDAQDALRARLVERELSADERAQLEATFAVALLRSNDPDAAEAREAFARALQNCPDANTRVRLVYVYADALVGHGLYEDALDLMQEGRLAGAALSPTRLKLEALRGSVLDFLGRTDEARDVYERGFESALDSDLKESSRGRDAARVLALRLARCYRDAGRNDDAVAVSRRLRAWLNEEDLLFR